MGLSLYDEVYPALLFAVILPATGTGYVNAVPAQPLPLRIDGIEILNNDTIAHITNWNVTIGGSDYGYGFSTAGIGAGYAGVPRQEVLPDIAPPGDGSFILPAASLLRLSVATAVLAGGSITIVVTGGYL